MKKGKISIFSYLWYLILGFIRRGYKIVPFFHTFMQALETDSG